MTLKETMAVPDIQWLWVSMYGPEHFIHHGVNQEPDPPRQIPAPPPAELYNIAEDPLEQRNLADKYPDRVHKMARDLETCFEEVEAERKTIDDTW